MRHGQRLVNNQLYVAITLQPETREALLAAGVTCGELIGSCGISKESTVGYMIDSRCWGYGIATETVTALVKAYWAYEGSSRFLRARVVIGNDQSEKVLKKCGFLGPQRMVVEEKDQPVHEYRIEY